MKHSGVLGAAVTGFNRRRVIGVDGAVLVLVAVVSDLKLLDFCMSLVGGVGQTDKVLLAFINGLFGVAGFFAALLLLLVVVEGKENAMFKHLSSTSGVFTVRVDPWKGKGSSTIMPLLIYYCGVMPVLTTGRTFLGVTTDL